VSIHVVLGLDVGHNYDATAGVRCR
jgi:hypothetical protein